MKKLWGKNRKCRRCGADPVLHVGVFLPLAGLRCPKCSHPWRRPGNTGTSGTTDDLRNVPPWDVVVAWRPRPDEQPGKNS